MAIHTFIYESQCANVEVCVCVFVSSRVSVVCPQVSELSYCSAESERLVLYAENSLETSSGGKFFLSVREGVCVCVCVILLPCRQMAQATFLPTHLLWRGRGRGRGLQINPRETM